MNKCEDCKYRAYEEDGEVYFYSDGSYEGGICREEYCSRGYEKSLKIMEKTVKVLKNCRTIKNKIESLVLLYFIKKYKKIFEKINF
ncbi:hypothetical protein ACK2FJ_16135 [Clostridioides difficile]